MKKVSTLFLLFLFFATAAHSQFRELSRTGGGILGNSYTTSDFSICSKPSTFNFRVAYDHCPNIIGVNCAGGCGNNPYRYTVKLFRDNSQISSQQFIASSDWSNTTFFNVAAYAGDYKATVKLERRSGFLCLGWQTVGTYTTNNIIGSNNSASPDFDIDGIAIPFGGDPIDVCISNIKLNAAATSCESKYFISVQECDRWWNRTYDYEFGLWFQGQAPNNINLQQLASTYSTGSYYTGDPSREGSILIGGYLNSPYKKKERYYRVNVCTGQPSWQCKTALIKVNNNCKTVSVVNKDTNTYTILDENSLNDLFSNENITVSYEADYVKETEEDLKMVKEISNLNDAEVAIFPNPAKNELSLSISSQSKIDSVTIYDMKGTRVKLVNISKKGTASIDVSGLTNGIYIADVITDGLTKKVKFVIKR